MVYKAKTYLKYTTTEVD